MPHQDILKPSYGLYLGRPPSAVPKRALVDCLNIRIKNGIIVRDNLGWEAFPNDADRIILDDKPVTLIDSFVLRNGTIKTIFGNTTDLFVFDGNTNTVAYLTPIYATGTVTIADEDDAVAGSGTTWGTNAKAGDFIHFGSATQTDPQAVWYEIESVTDDDDLVLTTDFSGAGGSGIAYTIRQTFTGDADDVYFTETFYGGTGFGAGTGDDRWYATNGINPVVAWDGVDPQVYLPNLGDVETCRFLRRDSNRMIYVAPTTSGEFKKFSIRTSDVGNPEETVSGEAIELIVHDRSDELLCAERIGGQLAIYGRRSVTMAQYVGPPIYYAFQAVVTNAGPQSSRAVAVFPEYHYFVGDDCQYIFDGTRAEYVNDHVWRDVVRRIVPDRAYQLQHVFDYGQGELQWIVPLTTDENPEEGFPEHAYTHHYLEDLDNPRLPDPHTFRDLPATVTGHYVRPTSLTFDMLPLPWTEYNFRWNDRFFFANFPQVLFGNAQGEIFTLNATASQDGAAPLSYARFGRVSVGDVTRVGIVTRIYPFLEQITASAYDVNVSLYTSKLLEGQTTLAASLSYNLAQDSIRNFVSPLKAGRFCEVLIGTDVGTDYWALNGYRIEHRQGGTL